MVITSLPQPVQCSHFLTPSENGKNYDGSFRAIGDGSNTSSSSCDASQGGRSVSADDQSAVTTYAGTVYGLVANARTVLRQAMRSKNPGAGTVGQNLTAAKSRLLVKPFKCTT
jgi:hypothetical protein